MVEQAYINVINAQAQYDAAVVQLKSTQEGYRVASEEFKDGAVQPGRTAATEKSLCTGIAGLYSGKIYCGT